MTSPIDNGVADLVEFGGRYPLARPFVSIALGEIAKRDTEIARLREALRWRDVRDELPEYRLLVLTINFNGTDYEDIGWLSEEGQWMNENYLLRVTHWLPLPALPAPMEDK